MRQPRAPRIVGVAGGVGTTTLAIALRGHDRGTEADQGVDVLVCRATGQSLHHAATTISRLVANGRSRPVLAVTRDLRGPMRGTLRARLRMIEPQVAALVVLPYVAHWRELTDPLTELAQLSERPAEQLPREVRGYGEALAALAALLLDSGLLHASREPLPQPPPPLPPRALPPPRARAPRPARVAAYGAAR